MKHSKIIRIISIIAIIAICGVRIYCVNSKQIYPLNKVYTKETKVDIENDFFDSSKERMNGYSIVVLNTKILPITTFYDEYNVSQNDRDYYYDYMYLVNVRFCNNTNEMGENAGIKLTNYLLVNNSFMTLSDFNFYKYVNDFSGLKFSLHKGTDADILLPFPISEEKISINKFKKGNPELVISLYPTRKSILL